MSSSRLKWLLAALLALVLLRIALPPAGDRSTADVAEAIVRKLPDTAKPQYEPASANSRLFQSKPTEWERDVPGNAFAVRRPPAPPRVASPLPQPVATAVALPPVPAPVTPPAPAPLPVAAAAPTEPPPPLMPYQVIGTWNDGSEPGVFLSGPTGTLLARAGTTLRADYKVVAVTAHQIVFLHIASQREVRLAVPMPPSTSRP
jgi:hypothetical protein